MSSAKGIREVGHFDCAGGGQIEVQKGIAYVAHMSSPHGTSIVDVRDPKNPKLLSELSMPTGTHSHKARVSNGIMVVNHERFPPAGEPPADWRGGFGVYDVSDPSKPRQITRWETSGTGCHRYDVDGHLVDLHADECEANRPGMVRCQHPGRRACRSPLMKRRLTDCAFADVAAPSAAMPSASLPKNSRRADCAIVSSSILFPFIPPGCYGGNGNRNMEGAGSA